MRAVSVLEVARPELWQELEAALPMAEHTESELDATRRIVRPSFERRLDDLRKRGITVLIRHARRSVAEVAAARTDLDDRVAALPPATRAMLHRVQRHARDHIVLGAHVWDPHWESEAVNTLHGAGLVESLHDEAFPPRHGRYRLHADLPPPPEYPYDFAEAVMGETDDLAAPRPGPVAVLHDLAALSAALGHHPPRRTHAGTLDQATARRLGARLGSPSLSASGLFHHEPRWTRALGALEALGAVSMDPIRRTLHVEPGLEDVLEGSTADAIDRLVHRLVEQDLQAALPAVRTAFRQAEDGAIDELVFLDLLAEQHRDVVFAPWLRGGVQIYPKISGDRDLLWSRDAFDLVEGRMLEELLRLLERLGLLRRAPGVFAATHDGRLWAAGAERAGPPVWVGSDLELLVPQGSVTPWERYQLERLGRCLLRDVVDRYRLEREGLEAWLASHELAEALDLLARRSPGVPPAVTETLESWAASATRFVLVRGVLSER